MSHLGLESHTDADCRRLLTTTGSGPVEVSLLFRSTGGPSGPVTSLEEGNDLYVELHTNSYGRFSPAGRPFSVTPAGPREASSRVRLSSIPAARPGGAALTLPVQPERPRRVQRQLGRLAPPLAPRDVFQLFLVDVDAAFGGHRPPRGDRHGSSAECDSSEEPGFLLPLQARDRRARTHAHTHTQAGAFPPADW